MEGSVCQVLNEYYDIFAKQDVKTAAMLLVSALDGISAWRERVLWNALHKLCLIQGCPAHFTHLFSNKVKVTSLYEMCQAILLMQWLGTLRAKLPKMDVKTLLSVDCWRDWIILTKSLNHPLQSAMAISQQKLFEHGTVIGCWYGIPLYVDFPRRQQRAMECAKSTMRFTNARLQSWPSRFYEKSSLMEKVEQGL